MKRTPEILGLGALILIIVPYFGKKYAPSLFGHFEIQVGTLILAGFFLGIGGVLSLRQWFANENRIYFICFFSMVVGYFGILYGAYLLLHSTDRMMDRLTDHSEMYRVVERALAAEGLEARQEAAAQYFRAYGVAIVYVGADGELTRLLPDASLIALG